MRLIPSWNLYWRLFTTSMLPLIINFVFILFVMGYFLGYPLIKTSVNDFSDLIIDSIELRQQLEEPERTLFSERILSERKIEIKESTLQPIGTSSWLPYVIELEKQLSRKLDQNISFATTHSSRKNAKTWFRTVIKSNGVSYLVSFPRNRLSTRPPAVFIAILFFGLVVSLFTSFLMARYLCRVFSPLLNTQDKLGQKTLPENLPIKGVNDIKKLAIRIDKMASEAKQLLANRTTLLVGVSHNLRNPIARLRLAVELLPKNTEPRLVEKMSRGLDDMNGTISEFLTLAKGMDNENTKVTDVNSVIQNIIGGFSHLPVEIHFKEQGPCIFNVQVAALTQVLNNLLENAIRYGLGNPVEILLRGKKDEINIQISDNGRGIPEDKLDDIFQPFVKFKYQDHPDTLGTGIGLAIVQLICDSYNWQIKLRNKSSGGLIVDLTLPLELSETH